MTKEKTELFVQMKDTKKVFFYGHVDKAFLTHTAEMEKDYYQLVLYYSGHVVFRTNYGFYPATIVGLLERQEIVVDHFLIKQLNIPEQQELLEQNRRKQPGMTIQSNEQD